MDLITILPALLSAGALLVAILALKDKKDTHQSDKAERDQKEELDQVKDGIKQLVEKNEEIKEEVDLSNIAITRLDERIRNQIAGTSNLFNRIDQKMDSIERNMK
jgi:hypothetical protein